LTEFTKATLKEEGAKIYKFYKIDGNNEFVSMEEKASFPKQ
jgi:hypothetical protein